MIIDSSDDNTSPQPRGRFATAGQTSINVTITHATEDKISSRKEVKALTFSLGRPQAQYNRALWSNRLKAFRTVLGDDLSVPPFLEKTLSEENWGCLYFMIHSGFLEGDTRHRKKSCAQ